MKNFSVEITRRCNMACAHCMRGDAMPLDIDHHHIRNVVRHFCSIRHLNITGGEPSLNPKAIRYLLKQLRHFDVHVYAFYVVTNGSLSSVSQEFIDLCCELYEYQEEKSEDSNVRMLELSDDHFHDAAHREEVIAKLGKYPFFGMRGQSEHILLFKEGRCLEGFDNPVHSVYLSNMGYVYGDVYLNAKGMICGNGDLSYSRQDRYGLCKSSAFLRYLKSTVRREL